MEKTKNSDHTFWNTFNQYKSLLRELTRKSLKLKYRDSVLGIFGALFSLFLIWQYFLLFSAVF